ncbi:YdcF family protein [bacterium]|nr:MAG: YdcF family protein [bacterium]
MTKRKKKRILLGLSILVGTLLVWNAGVAVAISRAGAPNPEARADVAIVLGAAVWDTKPSPVFAARIDHAIWLFERGQVKQLVLTGGRAEGDRLSEAEAAQEYALAKGVPQSAIYLETTSTNTYGNLSNANRIMRSLGARTAVIVSDPYHLLRAGMIADQLGIVHGLSPTPTSRYKTFGTKAGQLSREAHYVTRFLLAGN